MDIISLQGYKYFLPANYVGNNQVFDPVGSIYFYANRAIEGDREAFFD